MTSDILAKISKPSILKKVFLNVINNFSNAIWEVFMKILLPILLHSRLSFINWAVAQPNIFKNDIIKLTW